MPCVHSEVLINRSGYCIGTTITICIVNCHLSGCNKWTLVIIIRTHPIPLQLCFKPELHWTLSHYKMHTGWCRGPKGHSEDENWGTCSTLINANRYNRGHTYQIRPLMVNMLSSWLACTSSHLPSSVSYVVVHSRPEG